MNSSSGIRHARIYSSTTRVGPYAEDDDKEAEYRDKGPNASTHGSVWNTNESIAVWFANF